jgi:hypothetical protein
MQINTCCPARSRKKPAQTIYAPERYTFHTFSDAAANDRVVTRRAVLICCKVLEATANIMVNFPVSFYVLLMLIFNLKYVSLLFSFHVTMTPVT